MIRFLVWAGIVILLVGLVVAIIVLSHSSGSGGLYGMGLPAILGGWNFL